MRLQLRRTRSGARAALAGLATTTLLVSLAACGSDGDGDGDADADGGHDNSLSQAADQNVCAADATAIAAPYGDGFPTAWTFPSDTVVYDYEDRGSTGVIVTAVSSAPFADILSFLNKDEVANGFKISNGETEEDDAEANWTSDGYTGRWAIRKSASCDGETVIQVLATPASPSATSS